MVREAVIGALALAPAIAPARTQAQSGPQSRAVRAPAAAAAFEPSRYGGFGGLDVRFSDFAGGFGAFVGAYGAVSIDDRTYFGLGGWGLTTDNARFTPAPGAPAATLKGGYGGVLAGYTLPTPGPVRPTIELLLGAGELSFDDDAAVARDENGDAIFVFEPSLTAELKLGRLVRLGVGAGYRYIGDADLPGVHDADLRGAFARVALRVGTFGRPR